jgi:hypothetical protein
MFPNKVFVASNRKTKTGEATSYDGIITAIKEIYERQTQRNRLKVLNKLFDLSILWRWVTTIVGLNYRNFWPWRSIHFWSEERFLSSLSICRSTAAEKSGRNFPGLNLYKAFSDCKQFERNGNKLPSMANLQRKSRITKHFSHSASWGISFEKSSVCEEGRCHHCFYGECYIYHPFIKNYSMSRRRGKCIYQNGLLINTVCSASSRNISFLLWLIKWVDPVPLTPNSMWRGEFRNFLKQAKLISLSR